MESKKDIIIEGKNPVIEALNNNMTINKLVILNTKQNMANNTINKIIKLAKEKKVLIKYLEKTAFLKLPSTENHQGVLMFIAPYSYKDVFEIVKKVKEEGRKPFLIILDGITDLHNLGAIIRTAECVGVDGIIIPKNRSAYINQTVIKTSAGAVEYVNVCRVNNINQTIDELKKENIWIVGTDMDTDTNYNKIDYDMGVALVIGSEGKGIKRLTKEKCDFLVKIPMKGKISSLNASVATSIILYEVFNQRNK